MTRSYITSLVFSTAYNIVLEVIWMLLHVISPFNQRVQEWIQVRKTWLNQVPFFNDHPIWCHISSLGEYEQVLPVIEALKREVKRPIVLSFFSSSGFNPVKDRGHWEHVYYLPTDRNTDVQAWFNRIDPVLIIYVKYDLWPNFLKEGRKRSIPTILVSAIFTEDKYYFKPYGSWMLKLLQEMTMVFVQNEESLLLAEKHEMQVLKVGDTRVDRSITLPSSVFSDGRIEEFCHEKKVMIWASTHQKDEIILMNWWKEARTEGWVILWAPHHIDRQNIIRVTSSFQEDVELYSESTENKPILLIDAMGILKYVYRYADIVFMGGGFDSGIHNLLEPMSYGLPCIFGPNFKAFPEAVHLSDQELGFPIDSRERLGEAFTHLQEEETREKIQNGINTYMSDHKGATQRIIHWITENLDLDE